MNGTVRAISGVGMAMRLYAAIALGSMLGGATRWYASVGLHDLLGNGFPWGTLFVNVTGSFAIGLYAAAVLQGRRFLGGPHQREFVMTGFCGGYTTFSIFSLESIRACEHGQFMLAGLYVIVSLSGWIIGVCGGFVLAGRGRAHPS